MGRRGRSRNRPCDPGGQAVITLEESASLQMDLMVIR